MFHVNQPNSAKAPLLAPLFHVNQFGALRDAGLGQRLGPALRVLLADAELGEDGAKHLFHVDQASEAAQMAAGDAQFLGF